METSKHVYQIGGIKVEFPYKAYGPQLAYMGKIITTLERAFRDPDSSCNALLESPTGSGKSLALLCAALAWQQHRMISVPIAQSGPAALVGGGFIPEEPTPGAEDKKKKNKPPTIFFATRTHSQIAQVIRELKKTSYPVPMAVLASRKHYCTNKAVAGKSNLDEECKVLLNDPHKACPQFKNVHKLKHHASLQKGGCSETHDIEDLVNLAHSVKGCAYFTSRAMVADACIIFCPYNYLLNPVFRKAMDVDIRGAIIVFDEAHNIEDMSREAGSIDLDIHMLEDLQSELEQLSSSEDSSDVYRPLLDTIQELLIWIRHQEQYLVKKEADHYCMNWTGQKGLEELRAAGVSTESFSIQLECAVKAAGAASDPDPEKPHLTGRCASALEGLFSVLKFIFTRPEYIHDYQLVVQKTANGHSGTQAWIHTISFWCLNPAVVFSEIATAAKSVILTSGTLSPMGSFASELGTSFDISMEAPHIIDLSTQVLVSVVSTGPGNVTLNANFQNANTVSFQDALGTALEHICAVVPDGALVFFPSYKLLQKLCTRWKVTGQWKRISDVKNVFFEPQGSTEKFDETMKGFYKAIKAGSRMTTNQISATRKISNSKGQNGAVFLAVCRGKVSEGINFSDENARVVVVVGIPFPNLKDIQISMKKRYNDHQRTSKSVLGGDQWYNYQAFRALNQAVGRCIRHRGDYGAIVLLDERFTRANYTSYMSKWIRNSIMKPDNFDNSLQSIKEFFAKFQNLTNASMAPTFLAASDVKPGPAVDGSRSPVRKAISPPPEDVSPSCDRSPQNCAVASTDPTCLSRKLNDEAVLSSAHQVLSCRKCGHHLCQPDHSRAAYQFETIKKNYLTSLVGTAALQVIIVEAWHLQRFLFDNPHGNTFGEKHRCSSGIWVEEDGCVFRPILCGWCTDSNVILGAHVLAADLVNMHYADKVILFGDSLKAPSDIRSSCKVDNFECYVPTPNPKRPLVSSIAKGKLKLRKTIS